MSCQIQYSFKNANLHKNIEYMIRMFNFLSFLFLDVFGKKNIARLMHFYYFCNLF